MMFPARWWQFCSMSVLIQPPGLKRGTVMIVLSHGIITIVQLTQLLLIFALLLLLSVSTTGSSSKDCSLDCVLSFFFASTSSSMGVIDQVSVLCSGTWLQVQKPRGGIWGATGNIEYFWQHYRWQHWGRNGCGCMFGSNRASCNVIWLFRLIIENSSMEMRSKDKKMQ